MQVSEMDVNAREQDYGDCKKLVGQDGLEL